jgi:hypothetical protein
VGRATTSAAAKRRDGEEEPRRAGPGRDGPTAHREERWAPERSSAPGAGDCGIDACFEIRARVRRVVAERTAESSGEAGTKRSSCAAPISPLLPSPISLSLSRSRSLSRRSERSGGGLSPSAAPHRRISHGAGRSPRLALPSGSFARSPLGLPLRRALGNPSLLLDLIRCRLPRRARARGLHGVCGSLCGVLWRHRSQMVVDVRV